MKSMKLENMRKRRDEMLRQLTRLEAISQDRQTDSMVQDIL